MNRDPNRGLYFTSLWEGSIGYRGGRIPRGKSRMKMRGDLWERRCPSFQLEISPTLLKGGGDQVYYRRGSCGEVSEPKKGVY